MVARTESGWGKHQRCEFHDYAGLGAICKLEVCRRRLGLHRLSECCVVKTLKVMIKARDVQAISRECVDVRGTILVSGEPAAQVAVNIQNTHECLSVRNSRTQGQDH